MIKKRYLFICIIFALFFTGCSNPESIENDVNTTENMQESDVAIEIETALSKNHVEIDVDEGPEGTFYTVPMYFQQEFENVEFRHLNVSESGNLITCLAMLDSYYDGSFVTPDLFLEKYKDFFNSDGTYDAKLLMEKVAENNNYNVTEVPLNPYTLEQYVRDNNVPVLVHINHASIYGQNSSYIIITEITDDGQLMVRDPNKSNVEKYATTLENGETIYNSFDFFFSAGKDATAYIIGMGYYEIEEEQVYEEFEIAN